MKILRRMCKHVKRNKIKNNDIEVKVGMIFVVEMEGDAQCPVRKCEIRYSRFEERKS